MVNPSKRKAGIAVAITLAILSVLLAPQPIGAVPTTNSRCFERSVADSSGDVAALDIRRVDIWSDCRRLYFDVTTGDRWNNGRLEEFLVEFDLDSDVLTGCSGVDAFAVAIWDATLSTFRAATIISPGCDPATWLNNGQANVERDGTNNILMHIGKNTLRNDEHGRVRVSLQRRNSQQRDTTDQQWTAFSNPKAPAAPSEPVVTVTGGAAIVTWAAPHRGDGPIEDYNIWYRFSDGEFRILFRDPATPTGTTTTRATIPGVAGERWIEVQVRAQNAYGYGRWSRRGSVGVAPPMCEGFIATIVGTPNRDVIVGTPGNDVIVGRDGNDIIFGLGGFDVLCGENGKDRLFGGDDDDYLFGGKKNDILKGDRGFDYLFGQRGNDRLYGGPQGDRLEGGAGPLDRLLGKGGSDVCIDPQPSTTFYNTCEA